MSHPQIHAASRRLWGWENNKSCAFKTAGGQPIYYAGYKRFDFGDAPACGFAPNATNSAVDTEGRLWGWTGTANCAFKSATGEPVYYAGFKVVTWENAPACSCVEGWKAACCSARHAPFVPSALLACSSLLHSRQCVRRAAVSRHPSVGFLSAGPPPPPPPPPWTTPGGCGAGSPTRPAPSRRPTTSRCTTGAAEGRQLDMKRGAVNMH